MSLKLHKKSEILPEPQAEDALGDHERRAAIEKAKREWECTADALPALVCLLNSQGVVLRANRVVEHWGLGSVGSVIGKVGNNFPLGTLVINISGSRFFISVEPVSRLS